MDGLKVPFRSSSQQLSLDSFSCRFVRGSSMRPAPAKEGDASLADIAVRITAKASVAAAAAAAAAVETGEDGGATEAEAAALLDSSAVEDQVSTDSLGFHAFCAQQCGEEQGKGREVGSCCCCCCC